MKKINFNYIRLFFISFFISLVALLFSQVFFLVTNSNLNEIIPIYLSSFLYKNVKQLDFPLKPFYVSSLWTVSTCIIPEYESTDLFSCISVFLCIFSLTNIEDIKDYEEDKKYNVSSFPTKIGINKTKLVCLLSGITSMLSYIKTLI